MYTQKLFSKDDYYSKTKHIIESFFPIETPGYNLKLNSVKIHDKEFTLEEQKKAKLSGKTLHIKVTGNFSLYDENGKLLDRGDRTLYHIPYYTPNNTIIVGGNELIVANQRRLKPGIYTKLHGDGSIKSFINTQNKINFQMFFEPESRLFKASILGRTYLVYTLLKGMGAPEEDIKRVMRSTYETNKNKAESSYLGSLRNLVGQLTRTSPDVLPLDEKDLQERLQAYFSDSIVDPNVNKITLRNSFNTIDYQALLAAVEKILLVYNDNNKSDEMDSTAFNQILKGYERILDSLAKTGKSVQRTLAYRARGMKYDKVSDLIPSGIFDPGVIDFIQSDNITYLIDQINPIQMVDSSYAISSLGAGGISSLEAVPGDLRHVLPSHVGTLDLVATPESKKAGIDLKLTTEVEVENGESILKLIDASTGDIVSRRIVDLLDDTVALPGQLDSSQVDTARLKTDKQERLNYIRKLPDQVQVFTDNMSKVKTVPKRQVKYYFISPLQTATFSTSIIPFFGNMFGARGVMSIKHHGQSMPLKHPEEPLVQTDIYGELSHRRYSPAVKSPVSGKVYKITPTEIKLRDRSGNKHVIDLHNHYPLNSKTEWHDTPIVSEGDTVKKGQVLARNNFTDDKGAMAHGVNLNVAQLAYRGLNHEDGVVISESASQKLTSVQTYKEETDIDPDAVYDKRLWMHQFPYKYDKNKLDKLNHKGVIKVGEQVEMGDPLVLSYKKRELNKLDSVLSNINRSFGKPVEDNSLVYEHLNPGVVSEVYDLSNKIVVIISSETPAGEGDKITGRYGNKGTITKILPDDQMPHREDGTPMDVLMTPAGVVSRINPGQILEGVAGKIAEKKGDIYSYKYGYTDNYLAKLEKEAKDLGVPIKEKLIDPLGTPIKNKVFVGKNYIEKLHKSADTHFSARSIGGYDSNEQPSKISGDPHSAKTLGNLEFNSLIAANARENLRESSLLKSQKNDAYWNAYKNNLPLPRLKEPFVYNKFKGLLNAAGMQMSERDGVASLLPLTDKDIKSMSKGRIKEAKILGPKNEPEAGGLFDPDLTGGLKGETYNHIELSEPVLNPVFKESVALLLDKPVSKIDDYYSEVGGEAIKKELAGLNLNQIENDILNKINDLTGTPLNKALKTIKIVRMLKKNNLKPEDVFVLNNVSVIPAKLRPLIPDVNGATILNDLNYIYKDIILTSNQLNDTKEYLPEDEYRKLRGNMQKMMDKLAGLAKGDVGNLANKKGAIEQIAGDVPKTGYFQSKLLSRRVDMVSRGVATPGPDLEYNQVGVPEDMLWKVWEPIIERKLKQAGYSTIDARNAIKNRTEPAKHILNEDLKDRPVILNRAPSLWEYNTPAAYVKPISGQTIRVNPLYEAGMNLDYDGDSINLYVPVSDEAKNEAKGMTLEHIALSHKNRDNLLAEPRQEPILGIYAASKEWSKK